MVIETLIIVVLLAFISVYHGLCILVEFPSFNKISEMSNAERWIEALTHLPMYWLSAVAWYFQWISWQQISLFYFLALLGTGLMVWWIPFLAGPSQKWIATYKRKYAGLRPAFSSQSPVVPTLEIFIHHFLQLLVLSLMILSFLK